MKKVKLVIKGTVQNRKTLVRFYLIIGRSAKTEIACLQFAGGNARRQIEKKIDSLPYKEYLDKIRELQGMYNIGSIKSFTDPKKRTPYREWETDRKSTRLNSSHSAKSRMPSSA